MCLPIISYFIWVQLHLIEKEMEIFREGSDGSHLGSWPQSRVFPIVPASARSKVVS